MAELMALKDARLWERTLGDWLEYWAETTPDKEYIVYSDRDLRFTWSQFNERVDSLAKGLLSIGVTKGTNVGIWATNVPDWLTFLYATAKIGAVLVTVNTNYKQAELEYLCKDSDMHTLCITDGTWECDYVDMTSQQQAVPLPEECGIYWYGEIPRHVQHGRIAFVRPQH